MDVELEKRINDAMALLKDMSLEPIDFGRMDPVAKMMLVALLNEEQKLEDHTDDMAQRITERFCTDFIPREKVQAMPAVCLLNPELKSGCGGALCTVGSGAVFTYKTEDARLPLSYIPLFRTSLMPHDGLCLLSRNVLSVGGERLPIGLPKAHQLWIGVRTNAEVECVAGLSMLIRGTHGVMPEHVVACPPLRAGAPSRRELDFASMLEMENIEMAHPFDAQQAGGRLFAMVERWKECLLNMNDASLLYITDTTTDRDLFKPQRCPEALQPCLGSEALGRLDSDALWLRLDFPEDYAVPDECEVVLNVLPVTNVSVNSLMLTSAQPMAKLQKHDGSYFLSILETSAAQIRQGFGMMDEEIIVRDFEASCYHNGDLYRDVRNLYNRFIDDYYAFIEYHGIKDGETLKLLRETINKVGKSVGEQNAQFKFDSGTYVMKNMNQYPPTASTKVSYITTMGKAGNAPKAGECMDNRQLPALEQKVSIVASAMGGCDKASADERYEQLRYYSLTNDRLYTRMDVDAFLRKELMAEYGREEFRRIFIKTAIAGAGGNDCLRRGLYIDIEFKDKKNYRHAAACALDKLLQQKIENKSCIAMPIVVTLKNLEE